VVGGDPAANQPVWGRQAVEEVDLDAGLLVLEQVLAGIEASRASADHGNA
jgi:hypothetical protein